jgi:hypothetical protein
VEVKFHIFQISVIDVAEHKDTNISAAVFQGALSGNHWTRD